MWILELQPFHVFVESESNKEAEKLTLNSRSTPANDVYLIDVRGYCLEMICADFLAGANLDPAGNSDALLLALNRIYLLLPNSRR